MGLLDDILGKIIDMNLKMKAGMMGILNIKTAKNTYHTNLIFATPEAARAFADGIVAGNQTKIVENAEKLLAGNATTFKVLPESMTMQFANATIVASAAATSGVEGKVTMGGELDYTVKLTAGILPESTEPKK